MKKKAVKPSSVARCRDLPCNKVAPLMQRLLILTFLCLVATAAILAAEKQLWAKSFLNQKAPDLVVEKLRAPNSY